MQHPSCLVEARPNIQGDTGRDVMQFPVRGVQHELLGYALADSAKCGDTIWPQARTLAAKAYSVAEADISPVGVMLRNRTILDLTSSSNMPIPQLANEKAEWLVAPPAGTPSMVSHQFASQLSEIKEQVGLLASQNADYSKRAGDLEAQNAQYIKRTDDLEAQNALYIKRTGVLEAQISKHNTFMFHPLCIRQLCVRAADLINIKDGNQHGSGNMSTKLDAPVWAKQWLHGSGGSVNLNEEDLKVIYATDPGSTRGDANKAAHEVKEEDQAAAVRAVHDELQRESLSRIFVFVYGHPVHSVGAEA